ncbi:hypothetical protein O9G_006092 [Rozella allomycis CSF55]|uniref:Uncharacterized protein n=1 Tax=Rozella allomycis (strain CSF55) TaxID=988480 RepID=A0A075AZM0_ROZAC|nr:hypothetical protein O9G_006092 [Rozella allomycis CSF55]|eukprot:EPZ34117.1 hypothetical protein O9G_006092 [Rozella allomycis CSF55]
MEAENHDLELQSDNASSTTFEEFTLHLENSEIFEEVQTAASDVKINYSDVSTKNILPENSRRTCRKVDCSACTL